MRRVKREIVAGLIISSDNRILMGKKKGGGVYPDCWHIPGGGVEKGESKEEALIREIKEEVGIDVSNLVIKKISSGDSDCSVKTDRKTGEKYKVEMNFSVYEVDFLEKAEEIEIVLEDDLEKARWVDRDELGKIKLTPPSEKLFGKLGWIE